MPSENIHYPKDGLTRVSLNYDKKTGALTDKFGTLIVTWEVLNSFPLPQPEPLTATRITSAIDDIIQLKEAGFDAEDIINLSHNYNHSTPCN